MTEYTGRRVRISGNWGGDVKISVPFVMDKPPAVATTITIPAADLLGWLRAQGHVVVPAEAVEGMPLQLRLATQFPMDDAHRQRFLALADAIDAALSTTTKEGA